MRYAVCDLNGEIRSIVSGPYHYIECDNEVMDDTHYYDTEDKELRPKEPLGYQTEVSGLSVTLGGLPVGINVGTNGSKIVTDQEPTKVTYDVPGTYLISLSGHLKYLDESLEVIVGDP